MPGSKDSEMIRNPKSKHSWVTLVLMAVAVVVWLYNESNNRSSPKGSDRPQPTSAETPDRKSSSGSTKSPGTVQKMGAYEFYRGCTLAEARNNDGDSFMVRFPDGNDYEFRLYFVDTPESAFKNYGGGETNHPRIRQQAADLGGITPEQAVEIGKKAKGFVLGLLKERPFNIYTAWDSPFNDNRFHAFVEVGQDGKSRWLSELLVERGLARIKTKPADMPDGSPAAKQTAHLRELERTAKRAEVGVWGF